MSEKTLQKKNRRKALSITFIMGLSIIILLFSLGLTYHEPPIIHGVKVSFGNSDVQNNLMNSTPETQSVLPPKPSLVQSSPEIVENSALQETDVVYTDDQSEVNIDEQLANSTNEVENSVSEEQAEEKSEELFISEQTRKLVSNLVNNQDQEGESDADDRIIQDQGIVEGDPYANTYYDEKNSSGSGRSHGLNGRSLVDRGKQVQKCNEQGIVVVRISVDKAGRVVEALPLARGSTNLHPCLREPAIKTAMLHRWNEDPKAPSNQLGYIVVEFKVSQ